MHPKEYSLVRYPITQSPIYNQLDEDCYQSYWKEAEDARLVSKNNKILIPSLVRAISTLEKRQPSCWMKIDILSAPASGQYLYIRIDAETGSDAPTPEIDGLYRLDLSQLTLEKLSVTPFIQRYDLSRAGRSFQLLTDGKRLIKYNRNGVYLIDLEKDSKKTLYTPSINQWLISGAVPAMGQIADYDITLDGNQVIIGVYDKTITQDGQNKITTKNGEMDVLTDPEIELTTTNDGTIKPRLIKKVTITIPS
jgi:hypothetical protein